MDTSNWLVVISLTIGVSQGIIIFQNRAFKQDLRDMWNRMNSHGHKIDCDGEACKPRTSAVILNETRA